MDQNELSVWDTLNEISSPDFFLHLETQGKLESAPAKWKVKRHFEKMITETDYDDQLRNYMLCDQNPNHLPTNSFECGNWTLISRLIPVPPENRPRSGRFIWRYPPRVSHIDDIGRTKERLVRKAKHHKTAENLIIALRRDRTNDRLDEALLGRLGPSSLVHHVPVVEPPQVAGACALTSVRSRSHRWVALRLNSVNHAIGQIRDWRQWLMDNIDYARRPKEQNGLGLVGIDPSVPGTVNAFGMMQVRGANSTMNKPESTDGQGWTA